MLGLSLSLGTANSLATDPAASALIARMTSPPTAARAALINRTILALKEAGIWAKLEVLYFFAAADDQAALLNWVSSSFTATTVNAPAFTVDRGFAGNGSTSYLSSGWNPSLSLLFLQDSAACGTWLNTSADGATDTRMALGGAQGGNIVQLFPLRSSSQIGGQINTTTAALFGSAQVSAVGLTGLSRTSASLVTAYKNGLPSGTSTAASTARPNRTVFMGANNGGTANAFSANRLAMAFAGAGLSDAEMLALYNAANIYLTAVGGN